VGLHRVNYLVRDVPDVEGTAAFYREFGLRETAPGVFASRAGGDQLYLRPTENRPRVHAIGVGVDARSDLDDVEQRLAALGFASHREDREGNTMLVAVEPVTDIRIELAVSPRLPREVALPRGGVPDRSDLVPREEVWPVRLGHVVVGMPDIPQGERFFIEGLGMHISDHVIGGAFMRFETDHHNIVVVPAPVTVLHHTAWKVRSVDEIGYGGAQMVRHHPERHAWGLGRHAASANYFWYLKDPAGAFAEYYYSEMDELADTPTFWDPVPGADELPTAVWSSPPVEVALIPEAMIPDQLVDEGAAP
jgi:catechol 2,3-dioxygenase-like lactoylglutathione lyase family enzyme